MEKNTEDFLKLAPKLTEEDVRRINGTFRGFIFRRRKTGELWTSCCGKHTRPEEPTEAEQEIMEAEHIPEPRKAVYLLGAFERERLEERHKCPYCGAEVTVKELGRTGERKNLWSYRRGIVMKNAGRGIWAIAYEAEKSYVCPGPLSLGGVLTGNPTVILRGVYRFLPGVAEAATNLWWAPNEFGRVRRIFQPGKKRWMLSSPFNCTSEYGTSYETLGYEALEGTAFEFCGIRALIATWADPIRLLTLCCFYSRQVEKDSCMSRQGIPDYLVTMRKPGANTEPVSHTNESFPVAVWQKYASPVWMDIKQSDTLQASSAREAADERHICPLQLGVIRRALNLWTNPGDYVLTPFLGIGSEAVCALEMGRKAVGIELKGSYYRQAVKNCEGVSAAEQTKIEL